MGAEPTIYSSLQDINHTAPADDPVTVVPSEPQPLTMVNSSKVRINGVIMSIKDVCELLCTPYTGQRSALDGQEECDYRPNIELRIDSLVSNGTIEQSKIKRIYQCYSDNTVASDLTLEGDTKVIICTDTRVQGLYTSKAASTYSARQFMAVANEMAHDPETKNTPFPWTLIRNFSNLHRDENTETSHIQYLMVKDASLQLYDGWFYGIELESGDNYIVDGLICGV